MGFAYSPATWETGTERYFEFRGSRVGGVKLSNCSLLRKGSHPVVWAVLRPIFCLAINAFTVKKKKIPRVQPSSRFELKNPYPFEAGKRVMNTCCSSRVLRLGSQYPHIGSQLPVTQFRGTQSSLLASRGIRHTHGAHMCSQANIHTYTLKTNL